MNLMERRDSGLKNIIESYEFEENYREDLKPEFRSTETSFFTVLKNSNYVGHDESKKLSPNERRNKIVNLMIENSKVTASELSKIFDVNVRTIERDLAKLTEEGYIEYVGSSMEGEWKVGKKIYE